MPVCKLYWPLQENAVSNPAKSCIIWSQRLQNVPSPKYQVELQIDDSLPTQSSGKCCNQAHTQSSQSENAMAAKANSHGRGESCKHSRKPVGSATMQAGARFSLNTQGLKIHRDILMCGMWKTSTTLLDLCVSFLLWVAIQMFPKIPSGCKAGHRWGGRSLPQDIGQRPLLEQTTEKQKPLRPMSGRELGLIVPVLLPRVEGTGQICGWIGRPLRCRGRWGGSDGIGQTLGSFVPWNAWHLPMQPRESALSATGLTGRSEGRDEGGINCYLGPVIQWQTSGDNFNSSLIKAVEWGDVEVCQKCVGCDSSSCFPANSRRGSFQSASTSSKNTWPRARCTVVAKVVDDATAPAGALSEGKREAEAPEEQDSKQVGRKWQVVGVGNGGEGSAGIRPWLGCKHGLAGGVQRHHCLLGAPRFEFLQLVAPLVVPHAQRYQHLGFRPRGQEKNHHLGRHELQIVQPPAPTVKLKAHHDWIFLSFKDYCNHASLVNHVMKLCIQLRNCSQRLGQFKYVPQTIITFHKCCPKLWAFKCWKRQWRILIWITEMPANDITHFIHAPAYRAIDKPFSHLSFRRSDCLVSILVR